MTWYADPQKNRAYQHGEVEKIRWEVLPWCQGKGLDLGCGDSKVFPDAIGIDQTGKGANLRGDITSLDIIASESMDYVFSSHALEDIEDTDAVLAEWWRVLKVGGFLVLYLPHAEHYPNIGTPGANNAHKHDFMPEDIVKAMQRVAPDWLLRDNQERSGGDEYSFLQVFQKREAGFGQLAKLEESDTKKRCIAMRYGGYGDVLIASSTFRLLKEQGYHLTVYTGEKGAEVLKHDPHVDRVIVHDVRMWTKGRHEALCNYLRTRCDKFVNFSETAEGLLLSSPRHASFWWPHDMRHRWMNGNYLEAAHDAAGVRHEFLQRHYPTDAEQLQAKLWRKDKEKLVVIAATGTGVNKIWPHLFEYAGRLVQRHADLHVAVMGHLYGAKVLEHPRLHEISEAWSIRRALALACEADLVIGPETGMLNAVANLSMPKIVLLSHSSEENLTKHWTNTVSLSAEVPCYPCHRLHADWTGCVKNKETGFAACQNAIGAMHAIRLTEELLQLRYEAAA